MAVLAGGCGGDGDGVPECTLQVEKEAALAVVRDWYLYPELLPEEFDPAPYATTEEMIAALTARARTEGVDRGWTFVTTVAARQQQEAGAAVGVGFLLAVRELRLFVADVFEGSAAADAGFRRGDEIVAIGESADAMTPVAELIAGDELADALGPSEAGVQRVYDVLAVNGDSEIRTAVKRDFYLDPVPTVALFSRGDRPPIGYVNLRSFSVADAADQLWGAFELFAGGGVTEVAVDVRYNRGGAVSLAAQLAGHMGAGLAGSPMFAVRHNAQHADGDTLVRFTALTAAIAPVRVAFIVTGSSASASELVPSVVEPYVSVGLVGARTYGKPVGQYLFELTGCGVLVGVVSFRLENAEGDGGYFDGLPDESFAGPLCEVGDDLRHEQGDPLEASTAAALHWLETGACPPERAPAAGDAGPFAYPVPVEPTLAQRELPGLF